MDTSFSITTLSILKAMKAGSTSARAMAPLRTSAEPSNSNAALTPSLIPQNPLYFEAKEIERFSSEEYIVRHAWFTVCDPHHPTWQFYAPEAKITLNKRSP